MVSRSTKRYIRGQKSIEMKNFIFKSTSKDIDLLKIFTQLDLLLKEQRAQRVDLAWVKNQIKLLLKEPSKDVTAEDLGFSDTEFGE